MATRLDIFSQAILDEWMVAAPMSVPPSEPKEKTFRFAM